MPKAVNPEEAFTPLPPSGVREAHRMTWQITPEDNVTLDDMLKPRFWKNVTRKLTPGDIIEALWADKSRFARFIVRAKGETEAVVGLLENVAFDGGEPEAELTPETEEYEIRHTPSIGWWVLRKSDNERVSQDHQTKEIAQKWLSDYKKALKR